MNDRVNKLRIAYYNIEPLKYNIIFKFSLFKALRFHLCEFYIASNTNALGSYNNERF